MLLAMVDSAFPAIAKPFDTTVRPKPLFTALAACAWL